MAAIVSSRDGPRGLFPALSFGGKKSSLLSLFFFCLVLPFVHAIPQAGLDVRGLAEAQIPVGTDSAYFATGFGAGAVLDYPLYGPLRTYLRVTTSSSSYSTAYDLSMYLGDVGVSATFNPWTRILLRAEAGMGIYSASMAGQSATGLEYSARTSIGFRLTPVFTIWTDGGYSRLMYQTSVFKEELTAGAGISIALGRMDSKNAGLEVRDIKLQDIFPVFYSWYDDHSFGEASLVNHEDAAIKDLSVSFYAPAYMSRPKLCGTMRDLGKNAEVQVPLYALFENRVLTLTERSKTKAELILNYRVLGSAREVRLPVDLSLNHRNAMTWSDDRHAAAFVSAQDPAVLWFSRFVSSIVRDRMRTGIDRNLQYAIGMFEAERIYGISYVVDPASSYSSGAADAETVDYLQFPHQTIFYRGGDCDDLSILYTSLLQSAGIETAFITIPGHIYMAFSADMDEKTARENFYDPTLLIFKDGKVWIPVEITMVKDGFVKAWRTGAKGWYDNVASGNSKLYPMQSSWQEYKPVSVPNINPRFQLPDEAETMVAFDQSLDRYAVREVETWIDPILAEVGSNPTPKTMNEIGLLYARYGMLKEAWGAFTEAAEAGYAPAWNNLGNVAFIRRDYEGATGCYNKTLQASPGDIDAALGIARCEYELENYEGAKELYLLCRTADPERSARFGYLASIYGGAGRAWSLADRAATVNWKTPETVPSEKVLPPAALSVVARMKPKAVTASTLAKAVPADADISEKRETAAEEAVKIKAAERAAARIEKARVRTASESPYEESAPSAVASPARTASALPALPPALAGSPKAVPVVAGQRTAAVPQATPVDEPLYLLEGFSGFTRNFGSWDVRPDGPAVQKDISALSAKLIAPLEGATGEIRFTFDAQSHAKGLSGFGMHLLSSDSRFIGENGFASSYLVWFTHDRAKYPDAPERLIIYRSLNDFTLLPISDTALPKGISLLDRHTFTIETDATTSHIVARIDDATCLDLSVAPLREEGRLIALRTLKGAVFHTFTAEEITQ